MRPHTLSMNSHKPGETRIIKFVMILGALQTIHKAAKTASTNPINAKVRTKCQPLSKVITQMVRHETRVLKPLENPFGPKLLPMS